MMDGVFLIFILMVYHLSFFLCFLILEELYLTLHIFSIHILGFLELFCRGRFCLLSPYARSVPRVQKKTTPSSSTRGSGHGSAVQGGFTPAFSVLAASHTLV